MKKKRNLMYDFVASMKPGLAKKTGTVYHKGTAKCDSNTCNCAKEYPNNK